MEMKPVSGLDEQGLWVLAVASELELVQWSVSPSDKFLKDWKVLEERWRIAKPHVVLGVEPDASPAAAKKAYLKLVKRYHPDTLPADASTELRTFTL